MTELDSTIPYGCCHCGCGNRTRLISANDATRGEKKGEPRLYLQHHHKHNRRYSPLSRELYAVDPTTDCWVWQRSKNGKGYGQMKMNGKLWAVHRIYYEREYGPIPEGKQLDHLCRNRACVNPMHLEPVSGTENMRRGSATKVSLEQVREIRKLAEADASKKELARWYGISLTQTYRIIRRESWADV